MGDAQLFARSGPHALADVASTAVCAAPVIEGMFTGVTRLQSAGPDEVSFLDNRRYAGALEQTTAWAVIVYPQMPAGAPAAPSPLSPPRPRRDGRAPRHSFIRCRRRTPGIHSSALVDPDARVDASAEIGPYWAIEARPEIDPGCRSGAFSPSAPASRVGPDGRIGPHASLSHALFGARVYIYTGARIGQEGFSFATTKTGFLSIPQLGRAIVDVGANTTIDRGSTRDAVIGLARTSMTLVQIGQNVRLRRCCVIVAQVGIVGATVPEDFGQVGGQAAMARRLHICQGSQIGAPPGAFSDAPTGSILLGSLPNRARSSSGRSSR